MRVRHPAGRAGRPWLAQRLEVARRGAELLDEKQRALAREQRRLAPLAEAARGDWELAAREAERWLKRATVLDSQRRLELLQAAAAPAADLRVSRRTMLGVRTPAEAELSFAPQPERHAAGGSAALIEAARAHRHALEAALRLAPLEGSLRQIEAELRRTAVRRNAIERRWIPAHEEALAALELSLEELEREDGARVRRWRTSRSWAKVGSKPATRSGEKF
jgi:V/A-type H+-transporting ATPase subunit D